jgi:hypothetical protein
MTIEGAAAITPQTKRNQAHEQEREE